MDLSIIICTRNRRAHLVEVLSAYQKIKSRHAWELIIVDNNSDDGTADVISGAQAAMHNLKYLHEKRIGLGAARDRGWREANGDIIVFTDDDCFPDSDYINSYVALFRDHPDIGYVGGRIHLHDKTDIKVTVDYREIPEEIAAYRFIPAGTLHGANLAFRKKVLEVIGGVDPELGAGTPFPCEDIDMISAAAWHGVKGRYDPAPLVYHHHGRKEHHRVAIMRSYDEGRGAYYMKYILKPETRYVYLLAWARSGYQSVRGSLREFSSRDVIKTMNEVRSGLNYLFRKKNKIEQHALQRNKFLKLSVIICTRNRAHAILSCLDSVTAALEQAGQIEAEIVVVDNGSTDNTSSIVREWMRSCIFPIQLLREPRKGLSAARNCALRSAQGDLLLWTDDDCRLNTDYVTNLLRYDAADTDLVFRGGRVELEDQADLPMSIKTDQHPMRWKLEQSTKNEVPQKCIIGCNMSMRRKVVERIGLFDEHLGAGTSIPGGEDIDYIYRAYFANILIEYAPDLLVFHHHGRKSIADGNKLFKNYMIGAGALYVKYLFKNKDICRHFYWDIKNAIREVIHGRNYFWPNIDFSYKDKVAYGALGALKYFFIRIKFLFI